MANIDCGQADAGAALAKGWLMVTGVRGDGADRAVLRVWLCGQWLERAGFPRGGRLRVEVEPDRLVATTWGEEGR